MRPSQHDLFGLQSAASLEKSDFVCTWQEQRSRRSETMDAVLNVTYCVNGLNRVLRISGNN